MTGALLFNAIGMVGVGLYLAAYAMLQFGLLRGRGIAYTLMNLAAACCVLLSLTADFNLSSAMIQVSWITISLIGLGRLAWLRRRVRFTENELAFLQDVLPGVETTDVRAFLDRGFWVSADAGTVLTTEGQPVRALCWLAQGNCEVSSGGRPVGHTGAGNFVGEVTALTGGPATSTVTLTEPGHFFQIGVEALRELADRDPDLRIALQTSFAEHMRRKLVRTTSRVAEMSDNAAAG